MKKSLGLEGCPQEETHELFYMNRQNYLKRLKRLKDYKIINVNEHLIIKSVKILSN